jgi:hypothetical protein
MKPIICLALLSGFASCLSAQGPFAYRDVDGVGLELTESGKPVFVYNYGTILSRGAPEKMRRSTYLHPVYAPDGNVITDDFNPNHVHHRGISWMWPVVIVDGKTYDLWTVGEIRQRFVRWTKREAGPESAVLGVENGWYIGERKVMNEKVEIRTWRATGNSRRIDFTLEFEPTEAPVGIAGTPDQKKGFGGFCFRFAPVDGGTAKTVIRIDKGLLPKDGVMEPAKWAEVEGDFNGKFERARIDDDPSNPGYPNGWLLRHNFPFMNVSYPGLPHVTLTRGKPLLLKYRVTLFSGK